MQYLYNMIKFLFIRMKMGCRQVASHWFLIPTFEGSNPSAPVAITEK